jgi:hypothetical protein
MQHKGVTQGVTVFIGHPKTLIKQIKIDLQGGVRFPTGGVLP